MTLVCTWQEQARINVHLTYVVEVRRIVSCELEPPHVILVVSCAVAIDVEDSRTVVDGQSIVA